MRVQGERAPEPRACRRAACRGSARPSRGGRASSASRVPSRSARFDERSASAQRPCGRAPSASTSSAVDARALGARRACDARARPRAAGRGRRRTARSRDRCGRRSLAGGARSRRPRVLLARRCRVRPLARRVAERGDELRQWHRSAARRASGGRPACARARPRSAPSASRACTYPGKTAARPAVLRARGASAPSEKRSLPARRAPTPSARPAAGARGRGASRRSRRRRSPSSSRAYATRAYAAEAPGSSRAIVSNARKASLVAAELDERVADDAVAPSVSLGEVAARAARGSARRKSWRESASEPRPLDGRRGAGWSRERRAENAVRLREYAGSASRGSAAGTRGPGA